MTGASVAAALHQIQLDSAQCYHVRDLELARGDIKIYFNEGILSFLTPVSGRRVAALFTTEGVETGDAELLLLPPQRSERASLSSFTKTPNLDEHFSVAAFIFSDDTAAELLKQIEQKETRKAPPPQLAPSQVSALVEQLTGGTEVQMVQALLDGHRPDQGFFFGVIGGHTLGVFDVGYEPRDFEPVTLGRSLMTNGIPSFQLWTSFRPRHAPPYVRPPSRITAYRIDAIIHPDLSLSATAIMDASAREGDGRVLPLRLSSKLKIDSASIDGKPAEVFQRESERLSELRRGEEFLLIADHALEPGSQHELQIRYQGSVIRRTSEASYFVDERNSWFPYSDPTLATFDLTFHYPARLRLVSTGEPLKEGLDGNERVMHRRTEHPEAMAGFNLGDYKETVDEHGAYRVECYSDKSSPSENADIAAQAEHILEDYTQRWIKLPIHTVAVSPVPGYFGQGFPGLIYLSNVSYIQEENRPVELRNARLDSFFSELLLPHEVAHQWWGNIVTPADYRSVWLLEAMANDSALQFIGRTHGPAAKAELLTRYRQDLLAPDNGKPIDSAGPLDFGVRLLSDSGGMTTWHVITYEKGTWVLHMLRERLGEDGFKQMQLRLLDEFAAKPITTEDLRKVAGRYVRPGEPDKSLSLFFDSWVYGTGIPKLALTKTPDGLNLQVSGVDDDFTADIPLECGSKGGKPQIRWIRASAGANDVDAPGPAGCRLPSPESFLYSP